MARTRKKVLAYEIGLLTERWKSQSDTSWTGTGTPRVTTLSNETATMSDTVTPQYHERVARGEVITNAMDYSYFNEQSIGSWTYRRRGGAGDLSYEVTGKGSLYDWAIATHLGGDNGTISVPSLVSRESNIVARAKQKALAAVDPTPVSIGQDIAEIGSTLNLLRNPLSFIGKQTNSYSKKASLLRLHLPPGNRLDAQLRDLFLTYQYGVAPLWRSVMSVINEISQPKVRDRDKLLAAHGQAEDTANYGGVLARGAYNQSWSYDWTFEARATVLYRLNNPVEDWRSRFGLRTKDFPTILWEAQSLSFMIDRVFDVRSGIKGLMNLSDPSIQILNSKCSYSVRRRIVDLRGLSFPKPAGWTVHNVNVDSKRKETFVYSRSLWNPTAADVIPRENFRGLIDSATKTAELLGIIHSGLSLGRRR